MRLLFITFSLQDSELFPQTLEYNVSEQILIQVSRFENLFKIYTHRYRVLKINMHFK